MSDPALERGLWVWTLSELAFVVALLVLVANSLFGGGSFLSDVSVGVRVAALVFLVVELLIPLFVYLDVRGDPDRSAHTWVHAAAMPFINLFGVIAYLDDRRRRRERAE
ncbi:hypothetical protein [Halobaculum marinum]|uniref:Phospholipase_D-nuclease N-terminal n=1 Tax=Halobaculum marinum TaxID=3031996 RepID=A0ABD5WR70_9EURY|nr:hypothetical protein [Halobaculum sp. DT55]